MFLPALFSLWKLSQIIEWALKSPPTIARGPAVEKITLSSSRGQVLPAGQ